LLDPCPRIWLRNGFSRSLRGAAIAVDYTQQVGARAPFASYLRNAARAAGMASRNGASFPLWMFLLRIYA
jgi:hypothetical protein